MKDAAQGMKSGDLRFGDRLRGWLGRAPDHRAGPARRSERARERIRLDDEADIVIYAVGDVHGCIRDLEAMDAAIEADAGTAGGRDVFIVHLGDHVDRGPDSRAVLDRLMTPAPAGAQRVSLCGNHDAAFLRFLDDPAPDSEWLHIGGTETLASYGIDLSTLRRGGAEGAARIVADHVPPLHRTFLARLPVALSWRNYRFVHAGLRPEVSFDAQTDEDLMNVRPAPSDVPLDGDLVVVHGHTPGLKPRLLKNRICVDTGACFGGDLTAVRLDGDSVRFLTVARRKSASGKSASE